MCIHGSFRNMSICRLLWCEFTLFFFIVCVNKLVLLSSFFFLLSFSLSFPEELDSFECSSADFLKLLLLCKFLSFSEKFLRAGMCVFRFLWNWLCRMRIYERAILFKYFLRHQLHSLYRLNLFLLILNSSYTVYEEDFSYLQYPGLMNAVRNSRIKLMQ